MEEAHNTFTIYFNNLPREVRDTFHSLNLDAFVSENEFIKPLEEWQKKTILDLITVTFLGLSNPAMLFTKIKNVAEIARERAEKITESIEQEILVPHMYILEQVFEIPREANNEGPLVTDGIVPNYVPPQMSPQTEYREPTEVPVAKPSTEPAHEQKSDALDMFRKRLSGPVHNPAEKTILAEKEEKRFTPEMPQRTGHDPYKESID